MINQSEIPEVKALAEAIAHALPEDDSHSDPEFLARAALQICLQIQCSDSTFNESVKCARRFWTTHTGDDERAKCRDKVVEHAKQLEKQGLRMSQEWLRYALAMAALDTMTPSDIFAADYLIDFAIRAGIPIQSIRRAFIDSVPGLEQILEPRHSEG